MNMLKCEPSVRQPPLIEVICDRSDGIRDGSRTTGGDPPLQSSGVSTALQLLDIRAKRRCETDEVIRRWHPRRCARPRAGSEGDTCSMMAAEEQTMSPRNRRVMVTSAGQQLRFAVCWVEFADDQQKQPGWASKLINVLR